MINECLEELVMRRHIATALLVGMGIVVERPQVKGNEFARSTSPTRRIERGTVCRVSEFGHLKSAGRLRRASYRKEFLGGGEGVVQKFRPVKPAGSAAGAARDNAEGWMGLL